MAWIADHAAEIEDVNDLCLKRLTTRWSLWRGFCNTLNEANFDLAAGSKSNQILIKGARPRAELQLSPRR